MSTNRLPYSDCEEFLNRALAEPHGAAARFATRGEATSFRHRCNRLRSIDREEGKRIYSPNDPGYGRSSFDALTLRIVHRAERIFVEAVPVSTTRSSLEITALPAPSD